MLFASPLWLFALLPWNIAVLWILWGRRKRTYVPFLDLWRGPALQKPAQRALQPPPFFLGLVILAMLLGILAAAKPTIRSTQSTGGNPIAVVLDRGLTMSAFDHGQPRFRVAARQAAGMLNDLLKQPRTPVELWTIPGNDPRNIELENLEAAVAELPLTAMDTQAAIEETIRARLASSRGAVILLSDRHLGFDDPRLIQISPATQIDNVGIVTLAARETPKPQIMVRLRNDSTRKSVPLTITAGSHRIQQSADLPDRGSTRDYFIDLPKVESVIEAAIDPHDDLAADDRAWLVREGSYPKIEARTALSPELRRMIDVYGKTRPPSQSSATVAIVASEADLPSHTPGVIVAPPTGRTVHGPVTAGANPVAANVDWSAFGAQVEISGPAPKGWTPVASIGDRVIVASRSDPQPGVWVGFEAPPQWSATPDFVIFWTNVFTWSGEGRERFASYPLKEEITGWKKIDDSPVPQRSAAGMWPGLYERSDGVMRAFNAPSGNLSAIASTTADWRERLAATEAPNQMKLDATPRLLLFAITCIAMAAATWKRRVVRDKVSP